MDNDIFVGWNSFPEIKPTYDFDVMVEFEDGRKWIASWSGDKWDSFVQRTRPRSL